MFLLVLLAGTSALAQETGGAKVSRLLNESGAKFTKIADDTWSMSFEGKSMKDINVLAGVGDGILVTFALIPQSKGVKFPPDVLMKLLNLNDQYDRVKVGIDIKGNVFVRIDMTIRTLDKSELSEGIDQVAAAVDEIHGQIRTYLPRTK